MVFEYYCRTNLPISLKSLNQWESKHEDAVCSGGVFPIKMAGHLLDFFQKQPLKVTEPCFVDVG